MTPAALADPASWPPLADALATWLPGRRWFGGKARVLAEVEVVDAARLSDHCALVVADVRYRDGGHERYTVPLADAAEGATQPGDVVSVNGGDLIDATAGTEAACRLAALAAAGGQIPTVRGATVVGRPAGSPRVPPVEPPRRGTAEQSNTSMVFGESAILKLLRRLDEGLNPEVEVTAALSAAGFRHIPAQVGAVVLDDGAAEPVALAVLTEFVAGATEGWDAALAEVGSGDGRVAAGALDLGAALAELHLALRDAFGAEPAHPDAARGTVARMTADLDRVLALAAEHAAQDVAPLLDRRPQLRQVLCAFEDIDDLGVRTRIHGDLHLGQVLLTRDGRWLFLDFEGEPARPIAQRRAHDYPLRDVAGMLRSFDYAAVYADPMRPPAAAAAGWRELVRSRLLDGYRYAAAPAGLLPEDAGATAALLRILELDKAVYELGYELANRPDWIAIPVAGILRILGSDPS